MFNRALQTTRMSTKKQATLSMFFSSMKKGSSVAKESVSNVKEEFKPVASAKEESTLTTSVVKEEVKPITIPHDSKKRANEEIEDTKSKVQKTFAKDTPLKVANEKVPNTGVPIMYSSVVEVFDKVEATTKRLEIIQYVSDFFLDVLKTNPAQLVPVVYLFINRLGPDYQGLELGLGETLLIKTICESTGKSSQLVKQQYRETGDLGVIAHEARLTQPTMFKPKPLDVSAVFKGLTEIATASGKDSQTRKIGIIKRMLTACAGLEAKYLIRSLESKLRIGLAEKTVLISLAKALVQHEMPKASQEMFDEADEKIRDAFCQIPNYEILINTSIEHGVLNLDQHCVLTPGIPLKPMLAKPTKSISEVLDRFQGEEFTCEYKYDGERAQVHLLANGEVKIYSRNSEDMTQRYPDVDIKQFISSEVKSLILDCEAVAWDQDQNKILPFQVLSTRKRKDVNEADIKVRVCLFAFDMLCLNDEPLITHSLKERREKMDKVLIPAEGKFQFATAQTSSDLDTLQKFLDQSVKDSCEGLMVKMVNGRDSFYEPSKRSRNWLKLKKDYLEGVGDSLDLVVVGAYYGKGKRTGSYGGFLLACYNQDSGEYETCCKIGTGFSDEDLKNLYERLSKTEIQEAKSYFVYESSAQPDVWFEPTTLFEVLTADLSLSPVYKAGIDRYGKGISLRFPRFMRIRDDKGVEDATSSEQVIDFYESQANLQ